MRNGRVLVARQQSAIADREIDALVAVDIFTLLDNKTDGLLNTIHFRHVCN
jgi:hypothetical protein